MFKSHKIYIFVSIFFLVSCVDKIIEESNKDRRYGGVLVSETNISFESRVTKTGLVPYKIGESSYVQIFRSIYETLTRINPTTGKLEGGIAKKWKVNGDGSEYTFFLRTNVIFHGDDLDEKFVTAHDVKKCFDELLLTSSKSIGYSKVKDVIKGVVNYNKLAELGESLTKGVSGIIVLNDSTIRFELTKPYTPFPELLSNIDFSVFKKNKKTGQSLGTGPFFFDTVYNETLFLKRNNNYWKFDKDGNRLPYLDKIVFKSVFSLDIEKRLKGFLNEEIHLMRGIRTDDISTVMRILREENDVDFGYESIDNSSLTAIALNNLTVPFNNVNVRKAFSYAFDKNLYVDSVLNGEQWPAENGLTPPGLSPYEKKIRGNEFNLKKAKEYLAKAGYPNGKGFPTVFLSVVDGANHPMGKNLSNTEKTVMGMICKNLNVKLAYKEYSSFYGMFEDLWRGKGMVSIHNYTSRYTSPESYLNVYNLKIDSSEHVEHDNTMFFRDPVFDSYYTKALVETDEKKRNSLFYEAEQRIINQAPVIPVFYGESNRIVSKKIEGLSEINSLGIIDYTYIYFKKEIVK